MLPRRFSTSIKRSDTESVDYGGNYKATGPAIAIFITTIDEFDMYCHLSWGECYSEK